MVAVAESFALTPRWTPATLLPAQYGYLTSRSPINTIVAGRRSFKTEAAKRRIVTAAISFCAAPEGRFFACAPTQQQAKDIFWRDIQALVPKWALAGDPRRAISHSELAIDLVNGVRIKVAGLDKPQRIEGGFWDGGVITEYGNCKPNVFFEAIQPMMARGGWIDIEGVPEGRNHYYELINDVRDGKIPGAVLHEWTSEDAFPLYLENAEEVLARARATLDARLYQQEYLAWFVSMEGQAYYTFDEALNVRDDVEYDPALPLILCFDFNRAPGVCAYVQEHDPKRYPGLKANTLTDTVTACVGEVFIKSDSNTRKVAERVVMDWAGKHATEVQLHGDATGGAGGSAKVAGSDWDIIRGVLQPVFGRFLRSQVRDANPEVRARMNAVNARLVAIDGSVGTVISRRGCPNLIRDLEGVEADDAGEIVKENGSPLTHISDAFGYYIHRRFPTRVIVDDNIKLGRARRRTADQVIVPGRRG